jgi:hypothetical protein
VPIVCEDIQICPKILSYSWSILILPILSLWKTAVQYTRINGQRPTTSCLLAVAVIQDSTTWAVPFQTYVTTEEVEIVVGSYSMYCICV